MSLNFDSLELTRVPVRLANESYFLKAASGYEAACYQNKAASGTRLDSAGNVCGVSGVGDLTIYIVHLCLRKESNPSEKIPEEVIGSWPHKVVQILSDQALIISGLKNEEKPTGKKDTQDKKDGSS